MTTSLFVAYVAWAGGAAARGWTLPVAMWGFLLPLLGGTGAAWHAGNLLYFVTAVCLVTGLRIGLSTWRAGGRRRTCAIVDGMVGFALPLIAYCVAYGGALPGILVGSLLGWYLSAPFALLASLVALCGNPFSSPTKPKAEGAREFVDPVRMRTAAWGLTAVLAPLATLQLAFGVWLYGSLSALYAAGIWGADYVNRTPGPWDGAFAASQRWLDASEWRSAAVAGVYAFAYPALVAWWMQGSLAVPELNAAVERTFGSTMPSGDLIAFLFAVLIGLFAIKGSMPERKQRAHIITTAVAPVAVWIALAPSLPSEFAAWGVFLSVVFAFTFLAQLFVGPRPEPAKP